MLSKVIIADDYVLVREGIKSILEGARDVRIIGEAYNGETAIKLTRSLKPDIMLLKLRLARINAFGVLRKVRATCKVIILTDNEEDKYIVELAQMGAAGCFNSKMTAAMLLETIQKVATGELVFPQDILEALDKKSIQEKDKRKKTSLTTREMDILHLVGRGMSNAEISKELIVSEKTVKNHLTNIFKKINVNDRTQAFIYALKNKLVLFDLEN